MKLKEVRERKGLTQGALAKKIGQTSQSINQYESGKRSMSVDTLLKVIDVLDCSADELLGIDKK